MIAVLSDLCSRAFLVRKFDSPLDRLHRSSGDFTKTIAILVISEDPKPCRLPLHGGKMQFTEVAHITVAARRIFATPRPQRADVKFRLAIADPSDTDHGMDLPGNRLILM